MLGKSRTYNLNKEKGTTLQYNALSVTQPMTSSRGMPMQSTEKVNKKKKILNFERAPGICDNHFTYTILITNRNNFEMFRSTYCPLKLTPIYLQPPPNLCFFAKLLTLVIAIPPNL